LRNHIKLLGYIGDRWRVMQLLGEGDVFLFTHILRESPRCLKEALLRATPIVGYQSSFAQELIAKHGGGRLVPIFDWQKLGEELAVLARSRGDLVELIRRAHRDGARFTADAVFRERSEIMIARL
jgi:glycosyltransferase involved in cell wall biosynthesis